MTDLLSCDSPVIMTDQLSCDSPVIMTDPISCDSHVITTDKLSCDSPVIMTNLLIVSLSIGTCVSLNKIIENNGNKSFASGTLYTRGK